MRHQPWLLGILASLVVLGTAVAQDRPLFAPSAQPTQPPAPLGMPAVPVDSLAHGIRERVAAVLERPTLSARGPAETFNSDHATYRWLLDHPDLGVKLWRLLGAKVSDIDDRGGGVYRWHDGSGSEV